MSRIIMLMRLPAQKARLHVDHINKPLALRNRLGLTQKEAGMLILRNPNPDHAQKVWQNIERENRECDDMSNMFAAIFYHINWLIEDDEIHLVRRMLGIT